MVIITKSDLNDKNEYKHSDSLISDDEIIIEANLGYVKFKFNIISKKYIEAKAGSGIEAGDGIEAGWGIKAGSGIKAGEGIISGLLGYANLGDIIAKFIDVKINICAGFNNKNENLIKAEILSGKIILGKLVKGD